MSVGFVNNYGSHNRGEGFFLSSSIISRHTELGVRMDRSCGCNGCMDPRQWMQQDGATAHTAGESLACLQQHFGDRLISRGTEFPFPSHSPDLTAPDVYIWGMLKESVFRSDDPPGNVLQLREKIQS